MLNSNLTICPICEKRFIPTVFWAYKKKFYKNKKQFTIAVTIVLEKQVVAKAILRISQKREVRG